MLSWDVKWLSIHEALPGHYVQAEHANEIQPVTQVMMQQGFADNDPRHRISYLKISLRAVGNTILDVRMQTMGMTDIMWARAPGGGCGTPMKWPKARTSRLIDFHDQALDQGALPVPWLENILLSK